MTTRSEFVAARREEAWAHGRAVRDQLMFDYCRTYGLAVPPAPALVIVELLTDFLNAQLAFDPLPADEFARTEWIDGKPSVTINSLTSEIVGVKDINGTQNVGAWHEGIHIVDHSDILRQGAQAAFEGFETANTVVCHRSATRTLTPEQREREFWAEEAGRAAAVSTPALARSLAFRDLLRLAGRSNGRPVNGFPHLYRAAEDIGVNISALVKQLTHEGKIRVTKESGHNLVIVQLEMLAEVA